MIGSLGGLRKLFYGNLFHRDYVSSIVLVRIEAAVSLVLDGVFGIGLLVLDGVRMKHLFLPFIICIYFGDSVLSSTDFTFYAIYTL